MGKESLPKSQIIEYIGSQYDLLNNTNPLNDRFQLYFNLIQAKFQFKAENYTTPIYVDVKRLIIIYFEEAELKDFGYDEFRFSPFQKLLNNFTPEKRIALASFLRRKCKDKDIDISDIEKYYIESRKLYLWNNRKFCSFILVAIANNFWTLLLCYIVYILLLALLISPAPSWGIGLFDVNLINISNSKPINYIGNAIALLFASDEYSPTVMPTGIMSLIVYVMGKLLSYVIIGNYLFQKLFNYIKISDDGNY